MRAFLNLRYTVPERREAFETGLKRCGYEVVAGNPTSWGERDILVTWNRIGPIHEICNRFEADGKSVLVVENASFGNEFAGDRWYHVAKSFHNTRGRFPVGDNSRWDNLRVDLAPWRGVDGETVVLPQRGIGPPQVAMPRGWKADGRVRRHPGRGASIPLDVDLARASKVITWGSGAAIKALMLGIKVESHYPEWIGAQSNTIEDRLRMFRQLAWANWTMREISRGDPFKWLLL
jgi:hypothetical protein